VGLSTRLLVDGGDHRHQLLLVVRLLRNRLPDDELEFVDGDLHVIRLDEAVRPLHDPRLGISEVVLRFRIRLGRLGGCPRGGGLGLRARLQRSFGFANPFQPTLAPLQLRRQLVAASIGAVLRLFDRVRRLRLVEQLLHSSCNCRCLSRIRP
jgi:hypothetical protein